MPGHRYRLKKQYAVTTILLLLVAAGSMLCAGFSKTSALPGVNISDTIYAGSAACVNCHKSVYDSFTVTAHYHTSRPGAAEYIKGSFENGQNFFSYNQFMQVKMEKKDSGLLQTVYINGEPTHSESMDIVVGSGKKGQTFLYWKENLLYQLPVSYYVLGKSWCNSPGYPPNMPRFNRMIPARCLECHGSNAVVEDAGNNVNYFDKKSIEYGVGCERCHGPAAAHVQFHTTHPQEKIARYILKEKTMTRQQQLDLCALCHAGIRTAVKPAFSYKAGDRLEDFSLPKYNTDSAAMLDVHGNQYGLLTSSKCFKSSQMDCSSCHSVHRQELNQIAIFSQRCMSCHNGAAQPECKIKATDGIVLANNCVDCHMPLLPSKAIFLQLTDPAKSTADFVRSHRIAVYPAVTKDFIKQSRTKRKVAS